MPHRKLYVPFFSKVIFLYTDWPERVYLYALKKISCKQLVRNNDVLQNIDCVTLSRAGRANIVMMLFS